MRVACPHALSISVQKAQTSLNTFHKSIYESYALDKPQKWCKTLLMEGLEQIVYISSTL